MTGARFKPLREVIVICTLLGREKIAIGNFSFRRFVAQITTTVLEALAASAGALSVTRCHQVPFFFGDRCIIACRGSA
jgi:hypothetical protein